MVIKIFQTNLNLVWNLRLAKSIFFFPNQTGIGLENRTQFLGVTFPNQTGIGLEKDTEWNVAVVQLIMMQVCILNFFENLFLVILTQSRFIWQKTMISIYDGKIHKVWEDRAKFLIGIENPSPKINSSKKLVYFQFIISQC